MNKAELITSMAEKSQLTKKDAEAALKAFIDSVQEALEGGDKVQLVGFGTFETRERAAREGRNPRTKETTFQLLLYQYLKQVRNLRKELISNYIFKPELSRVF